MGFFFFFSGKLPTIRLTMTENGPHKGTQGTIIMIVPFFLFFSVFRILTRFLQENMHDQGHDDREWTPQRYARHNHNDCALLSLFFFCFSITYLIFTGKLPTIRLAMTWNHLHKGMPGAIIMIVPFFLYFLF